MTMPTAPAPKHTPAKTQRTTSLVEKVAKAGLCRALAKLSHPRFNTTMNTNRPLEPYAGRSAALRLAEAR